MLGFSQVERVLTRNLELARLLLVLLSLLFELPGSPSSARRGGHDALPSNAAVMTRRQYAKVLEKEPLIQNHEFLVPLSCPRATSPMDTTVSSVSAALLGVPHVYAQRSFHDPAINH